MNRQLQHQQAFTLYQHYLDLRKMREQRLKLLHEQQKRVQQHERGLFKIRNRLAKVVIQLAKVQDKLNLLLESNTWITADKHNRIHRTYDALQKEFSDWKLKKTRKHEQIDRDANKAKVHASHIIGIERALLCLENLMRQQFPEQSNKGNKCVKQQPEQQQIYFRYSKSQCSFSSIITATSQNSTSLSGTLLKKWLQPRFLHDTNPSRFYHVAA